MWILISLVILFAAATLLLLKPTHFDRNYLSQKQEYENHHLGSLADSAGFFIGSIGDVKMISRPEFTLAVNSLTPENALKMQGVFKDGIVGQYDS